MPTPTDKLRAIVDGVTQLDEQYGYILHAERESRILAKTLLAVLAAVESDATVDISKEMIREIVNDHLKEIG